ncbi:MAG: HEPN domain-containing protein [Thermodesulfobacteriota bacterium]
MKLNDLESQGLIERVEPDLSKVKKALERTHKDLRTARATLDVDEEWTYTITYHSMLRAGRALMLYLEYRPKGKDQHKTVGEFCSRILGEEYRVLINKFHRMRRKRHQFVYEIDSRISKTEAKDSIGSAEKLTEGIFRITKEKVGDLSKR